MFQRVRCKARAKLTAVEGVAFSRVSFDFSALGKRSFAQYQGLGRVGTLKTVEATNVKEGAVSVVVSGDE